jgi:hypothetical protein
MDVAAPRRGELVWVAVFAVALRVAIFFAARWYGHLSTAHYTLRGDTDSYIAWASAMTGECKLSSLSEYDRRVFPGYPAMIALVHLAGWPLPWAAAGVTWLAAGVAAAAAGKAFSDARVAWAMTCLIPHYNINSTLGMSEAPMLAMVCLGLLASQRHRPILAGALFGYAGLIRPVACFGMLGVVFALVVGRRIRPAVVMTVSAGLIVAAGVIALQSWSGDALRGPRVYANHPDAYAGHLLQWPMYAMIHTPYIEKTPPWRIVYTWLHFALVVIGSVLLGVRLLRDERPLPRDLVAWPWLTSNTLFVMCVGTPWGFRHFPRFSLPAQPALFWALREWLPRRPWWYLIIAAALFWPAVVGVIDA